MDQYKKLLVKEGFEAVIPMAESRLEQSDAIRFGFDSRHKVRADSKLGRFCGKKFYMMDLSSPA